MKRFVSLAAMAVALGLLTTASAGAKDWKTVVIGMEGAYEPYNLTDPSGKIVGFEPDLVMDLCARMKVECKIIAQDWDGMIPGLKAGKFDVIMDGMSITDERKKEIDFTDPLFGDAGGLRGRQVQPARQASRQRQGHQPRPRTRRRRRCARRCCGTALKGKTIGVQVSTTHASFVDKHFKDVATIKEYKTTDERDLDLKAGRIDVVLDDQPALIAMLEKDDAKDFTLFGPQFTGGDFGVGSAWASARSDTDLTAMFDKALEGGVRRRLGQEIHPEVVQDRHDALIVRSDGGLTAGPRALRGGRNVCWYDLLGFGAEAGDLALLEARDDASGVDRGAGDRRGRSARWSPGRRSPGARVAGAVGEAYSALFRGVPELLIVYFVYFGSSALLTSLGHALGFEGFVGVPAFAAGALAVGVISGAYQAEVYRGAYLAIAQRRDRSGARAWACPAR